MKIPGLNLIALPESDTCCGAAGTYNLTQPEMAAQLAERKLRNIESTRCTTVAAGNVGCAMHIKAQADLRGQKVTIVHPVELLHRAVFGDSHP
jgi:glycolate oxidase iron-sulfur subunit